MEKLNNSYVLINFLKGLAGKKSERKKLVLLFVSLILYVMYAWLKVAKWLKWLTFRNYYRNSKILIGTFEILAILAT